MQPKLTVNDPFTPEGYSQVRPGHIANVVTNLEMVARPAAPPPAWSDGVTLDRMEKPDLDSYRALYRRIGADWLWFSRLVMDDAELAAVLIAENVEIHVLRDGGSDIGVLELDFRMPGECEVTFLGLAAEAQGRGLGRSLMNAAIELAWARDISRLWLHTCTFDSPAALPFYIRSGFRPFSFQVETHPDPRLTGHLPLDAASHVPLIQIDGTE